MRYLYVDDKRVPPPMANFIAKDYKSAVQYLKVLSFDVVDLDYSLEDSNGNGYDLLVYMKENGIKPKEILVHSDHSEGRPKMLSYIKNNFY